nr:photosystem I subunit VIII [Coniogramme intermedia]YP_010879084.1 photosystem I subunit VIII [Coniogramme japonica]QQO79413.1 photosystem I subunit VIII [Coniogramme intermedia]WHE42735.1 photosystem I subunit VIII [Coniogramme japonica]
MASLFLYIERDEVL